MAAIGLDAGAARQPVRPQDSDFRRDAIVIGGGHNGLVTATYLARAGLQVTVLERRGILGGAAVTEEFHPGYRNSTCSYTVSLLNPKIIRDLDLDRHGLRIVFRPASNFLPFPDGRGLLSGGDAARTRAEIAKFSPADAAALPAYEAALERLADTLRKFVLQSPPNVGGSWSEFIAALGAVRPLAGLDRSSQRDLLDIMTMSAADFLARWFVSDEVRALFAFDGIVGSFASPYQPGTAYVLLHHCFGEVNGRKGAWGHAIGGMGAISDAIAAAAREAGVEMITGVEVDEILLEAGRAVGVRTTQNQVWRAPVIAANLNPKLLFLRLIGADRLPAELGQRFANYQCESATFRMNVALAELPRFTAAAGISDDHLGSGIIIAPGLDYMDDAWRDAQRLGWSQAPIVEMLIPSRLDATLAPAGRHVASLFCQHFRYKLPSGRDWDACRELAADLVIDTVTKYAPNFKSAVIARRALSPLDLEREFSLTGGDIFHGALGLNQLYSARPLLGLANYRMPFEGLYLCGSGAHPGGGVTGVPGHNAAREILADRRRLGWLRGRRTGKI